MFGTIRRHQTWLWAVIITFTIISFVYFFSPYNRQNGAGRGSYNFGSISGVPISEEDFKHTQREVYLMHFFRTGNLPTDQDAKRVEADIYQRLFLIQKQRQYGIRVSTETAARFTRETILRQFDRERQITPAEFVTRVLEPHGFQIGDLRRFVDHELGIQELIAVIGLSGRLATPQEIQALYVREHEEVETVGAFFTASNYLASVSATPEAVAQFYTNRLSMYRLPERIQVRYVKFGVSNYLAQAEEYWSKTNLNEVVDSNVAQLGTNYYRGAKTPEESRARIRLDIIKSKALIEASRKARDFARPMIESDPQNVEALNQAAATNELTVSISAPFDRDAGPHDLDVAMDFIKAAFALTPARPFAPPIVGGDGVYVFALEKVVPSEIPPLDKIRDQVTADYKLAQALMSARLAGAEFYKTVTNGMAQGKSFDAAAAETKVKVVQLAPFSISSRSLADLDESVSLDQLKQAAFSTTAGKVSDFQPTRDGGFVLYVKARLPINQLKMASDLPQYTMAVRQARQNEAFTEWFRKEAERSMRDTPLFRPQSPDTTLPRAAKS